MASKIVKNAPRERDFLIQALYSRNKCNGEGLTLFEGNRPAMTEDDARTDLNWWIKKQVDYDLALIRVVTVIEVSES